MAAPAPAPIPITAPPERGVPGEIPAPVSRKPSPQHRWRRIALVAFLILLAADYGVSELLRHGWQHQAITQRLEAAFGRPVEVGNYSFSLIEGPRLEANSITVGEDPRFGNEYFLRADQLAVGVRWSGLLRGRIELGTLSLVNPRLNLVKLPDGEWNLESWLPRPAGNLPSTPIAGQGTVRLERIEVTDGRANFKEGSEKLPFAFVNVDGSVERAAPGSWRIDLRAQPFRAAAGLQQAGELRLSGVVGGTSSRLRPASLQVDWYDASLPDILRLARGNDYGMRGLFALQVAARTKGLAWDFSSHAQFRQLHRWDLPERADDPDVNLNAEAQWVPGEHQLKLTKVSLETPRSNLQATGRVEWGFDPRTLRLIGKDAQLELLSNGVQLDDLLRWYSAFHPGVAEPLKLNGMAGVNLTLAGWPPKIKEGSIGTEGFTLEGAELPGPIEVGRAAMEFSPRVVSLPTVTVMAGREGGMIHVQGTVDRRVQERSEWTLDGRSKNVAALLSSAAALGFKLQPGWALSGPVQVHLEWKGVPRPMIRATQGTIALGGLEIRAPFLNREIDEVRGTVNLSPKQKLIQLTSAKAFSANWGGSIQRRSGENRWRFALTANALDAAEMDRWLNPQRRSGFLDRVFPFLAPTPQKEVTVPAWLNGKGKLTVGQLRLAPLTFHKLQATAAVEGRRIEFSQVKGKLYGGALDGSIDLKLEVQPSYRVSAEFRNVNLAELAARTFSLEGRLGGTASGSVQLSAKGLSRAALIRTLTCQGNARFRQATYNGLDLVQSLRAGTRRTGSTAVPQASAEFSCGDGRIHVSQLQLLMPGGAYEAAGDINYQRNVNLEIRAAASQSAGEAKKAQLNPSLTYRLTGPLSAPRLLSALRRPPAK
jgi:uncharacterized protein involved in outer membrane biogenesis